MAQAEGDLILEKEKYIDAVIGPQSYHKFNETLLKIEKDKTKLNFTDFNTIDKFDKLSQNKNSNSDVSSFLTIQEGCDKFCNFCVVPYTRGAEFSRSFDELISESNDLANNGVKEITFIRFGFFEISNRTSLSDPKYEFIFLELLLWSFS